MTATQTVHAIVSNEKWLQARGAVGAGEGAHAATRRTRPQAAGTALGLVETNYVFELFEGPQGSATLSDLFAGRTQLMIYHLMFGPGWAEGCPSCSMLADNID
jgi:predicted dithiol-disulfide oxidoreductase (DUF899 family)